MSSLDLALSAFMLLGSGKEPCANQLLPAGKHLMPWCCRIQTTRLWWMWMDSNHQCFLCHGFTVRCLQPIRHTHPKGRPWAVPVLRSWIPYGRGIAIASSWIVSSLYFNYNTVEKRRAISNFVLCVLPRFSLHQNIYYTLLVTNNQAKIFCGFG